VLLRSILEQMQPRKQSHTFPCWVTHESSCFLFYIYVFMFSKNLYLYITLFFFLIKD
jgi:hypothetical protein